MVDKKIVDSPEDPSVGIQEGTPDVLTADKLDAGVTEDSDSTLDNVTGGEPKPEVVEPVKGAAKTVYTTQEIEEVLKSGGEIDTSRLSPEGKLLMKSFQRGLEPKFQQLAELRKKLESGLEQSQDPKEKLFRRYVQAPAQVVSEINAEIEALEQVDPTDANYLKSRRTIAQLHSLKDEFSLKRQSFIDSARSQEVTYAKAQAELLESIPDFDKKAPKLTEFAREMGLTTEEIQAISDPTLFGPLAVKLTRALNNAYDRINAGKAADKKVDKGAPAPLTRPGSGGELEKGSTKDPEKMTIPEYRKWRESQKRK